ncbi:MAG: hypothetical protein HKP40_00590 [Litoreibacter sp.]|nr:hypothetical protein [Litoreibacter sp.]
MSYNQINLKTTDVDYLAIERRAHEMRAEAMRDMLVAARKWIAGSYAALTAPRGKHA